MTGWTLVLPPSRPSFHQLEIIRNSLVSLPRDEPVAVLGCTPEFRDLLCEMEFTEVHVLDHSRQAYDLMTALRVTSGPPEHFILGDWESSLAGLAGRFQVILSDLTSGNLPYERLPAFYNAVDRSLAPRGLFMDKVLAHRTELLRIDDLFAKYATRPLNLVEVNYFSCEVLFCSELLQKCKMVDSSEFYAILEQRARTERLRAFVNNSKRITPPGFVWYYGEPWSHLERSYGQGMQLLDEREDFQGSPYYGRATIFCLEKGPSV